MDLNVPIDITAINNTAREKQPEIRKLLMQNIQEQFAEYRKFPGSVRDSEDIVTFKNGKIMGSYNPDLTTKEGNVLGVLSKRTLQVRVGQGLIVDEKERYRKTYLGTLQDLGIKDPAKLPFAQWYIETYKAAGLNDLSIVPWQGVYSDGGANPEDIANGYLKIIADEITATNITTAKNNLYELTGAATDYDASNIGDELKAQFELLPPKQKKKGANIYIPYRYKQIYKEWFKSEYPNVTDGDVPTTHLDGTDKKARFVWHEDMGTTKRVVITTPENLVYGLDGINNEFGQILVFWYNGNPNLVAAQTKTVLGFQIGTLDSSLFNVNNLS
ncbi:MAG: hypothetical protein U9N34_01590 [Candidatus Cloacimonadota bacterium]|nr:hypothetical protein [Candidatus Cloacimonadota bacterium]